MVEDKRGHLEKLSWYPLLRSPFLTLRYPCHPCLLKDNVCADDGKGEDGAVCAGETASALTRLRRRMGRCSS
eukprot:3797994-Rhodomonas_salina.1